MDNRTGAHGNKRTGGDHSDNCIIKIGQNTKKSPGNLRRLAVTKIQVRNHQITLVGKTQKSKIMITINKCRLCSDREETINLIISECSTFGQKEYKTGHDWVGKVIHRELS